MSNLPSSSSERSQQYTTSGVATPEEEEEQTESNQPPVNNYMYEITPNWPSIHLDIFKDITVERYILLKTIENANKIGLKIMSEDWKDYIKENIHRMKLTSYFNIFNHGYNENSCESSDHLSHYILRLAFCKNLQLQEWFIELELYLFRLKFSHYSKEKQQELYKIYCGVDYKPIDVVEKNLYNREILESTPDIDDIFEINFYKISFYQVNNLVSERKIFMRNGLAYVPEFQLNECLVYLYREKLKPGLLEMCNFLDNVERDERVKNLFDNLDIMANIKHRTLNPSFCTNNNKLDDIKKHFPLCMSTLNKKLTNKNHLKHQERIQYGLFLKDIGYNFEQLHEHFRQYFCKEIDEKIFFKKYSYGIKYMYGLTGRRIVQNAYDCSKILEKDVVCGGEYGCPFKHWDEEKLKQVLLQNNLNRIGMLL